MRNEQRNVSKESMFTENIKKKNEQTKMGTRRNKLFAPSVFIARVFTSFVVRYGALVLEAYLFIDLASSSSLTQGPQSETMDCRSAAL